MVRGLVAVLLMLAAAMICPANAGTARAATTGAAGSGLSVRIDELTPSSLSKGATVSMSGVVQNTGKQLWRNAYAYLVIAHTPFTTRAQVEAALTSGGSYTGDRVVDVGLFDELGDLAAGSEHAFSLKVPYGRLRLNGSEGIYPVGVQILATDTDGSRSPTALAKATTFLPWPGKHATAVPTGLVWTFGLPSLTSSATGDARRLLDLVSRGGTMRRQLALASATPADARTILLDPALLDAVTALSTRKGLPTGLTVTRRESHAATAFLDQLLDLVRSSTTWVTGYGRPDTLALATHTTHATQLSAVVDRATQAAQAAHQISGRQVSFPTAAGVTQLALTRTRSTDVPVVVSRSSVPEWEDRLGSVVTHPTSAGPVTLVVDSSLPDVPGSQTTTTLRQSILTNAALASLSRETIAGSRADALTFVDPGWRPAADASAADLISAITASGLTTATTAEQLLRSSPPTYSGDVASTATDKPLSAAQLSAAALLAQRNATLAALVDADDEQQRALDDQVALAVSSRWRADRARALRTVKKQAAEVSSQVLRAVSVTGPPNVTLSGRTGTFPLTIENPTAQVLHVAIRFSSSNSAVHLKDLTVISVDPRERRTVDASIDVGEQSSTTVTAQLVTSTGVAVGTMAEFNVRSSQVGLIVWIAMGLAGALIVVAFGRRFSRKAREKRARLLAEQDQEQEHSE